MSPVPGQGLALLALTGLLSAWGQEPRSEGGAQPADPATAAALEEGEDQPSRWFDPEDGWLDLSRFLAQPHGFLPLVIPITEPALGYGVAGGPVFLHPREEAGAEGWVRPNMTLVAGLWTEDGSEGLAAANMTHWSGGDLQTLVGGGSFGLELELHGIGEDPVLEDAPLEYGLDLVGGVGEARKRLGKSDVWVAGRLVYARAEVHFEGSGDPFPDDDDVTLAGPAVALRYDSLNNLFTPTRGVLGETSVSLFDRLFGGSRDFQLWKQVLIGYHPLHERLFLGARVLADFSFGDTPFYARPYIHLRGVPALRYQGEHAFSTELELRWQFHPRISLVAFGGGGLAWTNLESFDREQSAFSEGAGLRYEVARKFGIHVGLDVARGPEEGAIYVQFGSAWVRP